MAAARLPALAAARSGHRRTAGDGSTMHGANSLRRIAAPGGQWRGGRHPARQSRAGRSDVASLPSPPALFQLRAGPRKSSLLRFWTVPFA